MSVPISRDSSRVCSSSSKLARFARSPFSNILVLLFVLLAELLLLRSCLIFSFSAGGTVELLAWRMLLEFELAIITAKMAEATA